jgi:hypothetical protein
LSLLVGVLVLVATVVGTLVLARRDQGELPAYRLVRSVGAFHIIALEEVEIASVAEGSGDAPATSVLGRIVLHSARPGDTLLEADLGSTPRPGAIVSGGTIVGIPATTAQAMAGRLERGSSIVITMSEPPHDSLDATLLDLTTDANGSDRPYVMLVAVVKASDIQLTQLASGRVAVSVSALR